MKKKVAIFGGSFNPPHIGHKKLVELVRDSFGCDEIWLMPSGNRADKKMHISNKHRLALTHMMAKKLQKEVGPIIHVSTIELDKTTETNTIGTLRELEEKYPDHEFYFIVSSELVPGIKVFWEEGEELFNKGKYVVLERTGSHKLEEIELPPSSTVIRNHTVIPEISSTILRSIVSPEELTAWTEEDIADYIITNKMYGFAEPNNAGIISEK